MAGMSALGMAGMPGMSSLGGIPSLSAMAPTPGWGSMNPQLAAMMAGSGGSSSPAAAAVPDVAQQMQMLQMQQQMAMLQQMKATQAAEQPAAGGMSPEMMQMMLQLQGQQAAAAEPAATDGQQAMMAMLMQQAQAKQAQEAGQEGMNPEMMAMLMQARGLQEEEGDKGANPMLGMLNSMMGSTGIQPGQGGGGGKGKSKGDNPGGSPNPNLFVGNLPRHMDEKDLHTTFSQVGTIVSCKVSIDPATGKSKGSGFVKFTSTEEAQHALDTFNGTDGLQVNFAYTTGGSTKGTGKAAGPSDNLYVRGLPSPSATQEHLAAIFVKNGFQIIRTKVIPDTKGQGSSAALVQVGSVDQATQCIAKLNGSEHFGNFIQMSYVDRPPGEGPSPANLANFTLKVKFQEGLPVTDPGYAQQTNLYIGGLPAPQVDQEQLHQLFETLNVKVVRSRLLPDTRNQGFSAALVQLSTHEEGASAIEVLNGQQVAMLGLKGVAVTPGKSPWAGSPGVFHGEVVHGNLFIGNLPKDFGEAELKNLFIECGTIMSCKVVRHPDGSSKGSGFVKMSNTDEAKFAIGALNGVNNLQVKPADNDGANVGQPKAAAWAGNAAWGADAAWAEDEWGGEWGNDLWSLLGAWGDSWGGGGDWGKGKGKGKTVAPSTGMQKLHASKGPQLIKPASTEEDEMEMEITVSFSGGSSSDPDAPSQTLFILGLPSPQIEDVQMLELLISMGIKAGRIEVIPDESGSQCSAAMVEFQSIANATQAKLALEGKKPSQLGLTAKGKRPPAAKGGKGKGAHPATVAPAASNSLKAALAKSMQNATGGAQPESKVSIPTLNTGGATKSAGKGMTVKFGEKQGDENIYISGLPAWVTTLAVKGLLEKLSVAVAWCKVTGGTAIVQVATPQDGQYAIECLNGKRFEDASKEEAPKNAWGGGGSSAAVSPADMMKGLMSKMTNKNKVPPTNTATAKAAATSKASPSPSGLKFDPAAMAKRMMDQKAAEASNKKPKLGW